MCTALPTVGFIGLGIMGLPMVRHLCDAGYAVSVYNRTPGKVEQAKALGAYAAPSPEHLGRCSDIVITMVTDGAAIRAVMDGPQGFLASPKKTLVWLQMSTIDIASTVEFSERAANANVVYIDCPVSGSQKQVEAAELILMAGAESQALEYVKPLLSRLGKTIIHAGQIGDGTALKLCMNLIVAQMTTALAESVALAETTGINPQLIFKVLKASPALNCGYYTIKEKAFIQKDFTPAFSLDNLAKDVGFMLQEAQSRGLTLPVTDAVYQALARAQADHQGSKDVAAVYSALKSSR